MKEHQNVSPNRGYADVLVGLQYGDEGKAKIIDLLCPDYDVIARFNGGANAGHTIESPDGRVVLQQIPSGVFHRGVTLYIGSGCALNLWKLVKEIDLVEAAGCELAGRLVISDRCAVVQPAHFLVDALNSGTIGTTRNGIGPCYADRAARVRHGRRTNFQLRDLLSDPGAVVAAMRASAATELSFSDGVDPGARADLEAHFATLIECVERVRQYVQPDREYLVNRVSAGARVLFEGAQSLELDVVHGDQPYVTASHTVPAFAYVGGDLPPQYHRFTIGVAKAVMSRVGNGPFRSELGGDRSAAYFEQACETGRGRDEELAEHDAEALLGSGDPLELGMAMRMLTNEYGAGTGRPRRIGLLDLAQLRDAASMFGIDVLYLNKVDCLTLYQQSMYGGVPVQIALESAGVPQVQVVPSFTVDGVDPADPATVPDSLAEFKAFVELAVGVPVIGFGLGPERQRTVQFFRLGDGRPAPEVAT